MNFSEFYKELELPNDADENDIKKAYKKLAIKYHPDKNPENKEEAENKFKKISEAYQALIDKEKYIRENIGSSQKSTGVPHGFINPEELFRNFFNSQEFNNQFSSSMNINIGNLGIRQGSVMRSSNIRFENGKKIETIVEVVNGVQRKQTIISQVQPNIQSINLGVNINNLMHRSQ